MIWALILLTTFLTPLLYWMIKFRYYENYLKKLPGPYPWPIIGSALEFNSTKKIMETMWKYRKIYKGNYKVYLGYEPMVVITEPKTIEYFLSNSEALAHQRKSKQYAFFRNWLGYGLAVNDGHNWKTQRKLITPAFHFNVLKEYVKIFDSVSKVLVEVLKQHFNETVDLYHLTKLAAFDIIYETATGTSVDALRSSNSTYLKSVEQMGKIVITRFFSLIQSINFLYKFTENAKIETSALKVIHEQTRSVIEKRKGKLSEKMLKLSKEQNKNQTFLDLLLTYSTQGENLTDAEIQQEIDTLIFAGHDTTSSAMAFTLYCISKEQRVQNKIVEELSSVLGDDLNKSITYNDLQEMKYLDMVVKESLRMYPAGPMFFREVTKDIVFDGITYPRGVMLTMFIYGMHHDPNYFKDPEKFYPERFETEHNAYRTGGTFSYAPFGVGPRNCMGQKFAALQLKTIIANVLRHCSLISVEDHEVELAEEIVLVPVNGTPVHILPRC